MAPIGMRYINAIRNMPKMASGAAFDIWSAKLGVNSMKSAPMKTPEIETIPPTTLPTRK